MRARGGHFAHLAALQTPKAPHQFAVRVFGLAGRPAVLAGQIQINGLSGPLSPPARPSQASEPERPERRHALAAGATQSKLTCYLAR